MRQVAGGIDGELKVYGVHLPVDVFKACVVNARVMVYVVVAVFGRRPRSFHYRERDSVASMTFDRVFTPLWPPLQRE